MLHLLKYQFLQTIRSRSIMFWALAFPLILGTLFYVSFGNTGLSGSCKTGISKGHIEQGSKDERKCESPEHDRAGTYCL